jgi:hypothetical protein
MALSVSEDLTMISERQVPRLQVRFLGCSQSLTEVLYSSMILRHAPDQAFEIWEEIRRGDITTTAMQRMVWGRAARNYPQQLRHNVFIFGVDHISLAGAALYNPYQIAVIRDSHTTWRTDNNHRADSRYVLPPTYRRQPDIMAGWVKLQAEIDAFQSLCRDCNISPAEAGVALPLATSLRSQFIVEFKGLQSFIDDAMCEKSQWEIREMGRQIVEIMQAEFPILAERLGAKCSENRNLCCEEPYDDYVACRWYAIRPHRKDLEMVLAPKLSSLVSEPAAR